MKKTLIIVTLVLAAGLILIPLEGRAQMGPGYGPGPEGYEEWHYCPYCGQPLGGPGYGRGPAYEGGPGYGMGPGMMHRYWSGDPRYRPRYGFDYQQPQKPVEKKEVREMLENYLKSMRNPNLKVGKIKEKDSYFEAEILTKDDSLADKIVVDKNTGWMRSIY